jgi:hypothetical protein
MAKDAQPSSHSSFQRFEKVLKALIAVPKKELDEKAVEWKRERKKRKA